MQALPAVAKAGIVVGGYFTAFLLALGVVWIYIERTAGPDREASGGMYAFGDFLLFVAVFGVVSTVPTIVTLVVLRRSRSFWTVLSVLALAIASTSVAEVAATVLVPQSTNLLVMLAFPRIFMSPFLAVPFGLAAWAAPGVPARWCLLAAAGMEAASAIFGFFHWFVPLFLSR
jgi:hypothetical protein